MLLRSEKEKLERLERKRRDWGLGWVSVKIVEESSGLGLTARRSCFSLNGLCNVITFIKMGVRSHGKVHPFQP